MEFIFYFIFFITVVMDFITVVTGFISTVIFFITVVWGEIKNVKGKKNRMENLLPLLLFFPAFLSVFLYEEREKEWKVK
jgi:hypothetical protein